MRLLTSLLPGISMFRVLCILNHPVLRMLRYHFSQQATIWPFPRSVSGGISPAQRSVA